MFEWLTNNHVTILVLISFISPCVVIYLLDRISRKRLAHIPGPSYRFPLIGTLDMIWRNSYTNEFDKLQNLMAGLARIYKNHGLFKFQLGPMPWVLIFHHDLAQDLLKDNSNLEKPLEYQILYNWLGKGLLINDNSLLWKQRRKLLTPAFHFKIIEEFVPIINGKANTLIDNFKKNLDKDSFDAVPYLFACALDAICETAMGIQLNSQQNENQEYLRIVHRMSEVFFVRLIKPWLLPDFIFKWTAMGRETKRNLNFLHEFTRNVIKDRKEALINGLKESNEGKEEKKRKRLAFLDLLLDLHLKENCLTLEDIREEVDTFMFAGHDTTACCLSWTLYILGHNPEVQLKARQELDNILTKDEDISIDHLKKMSYIEAIIKESMRIYPPVPLITRKITKDLKVGQYSIPSGTSLHLYIKELHMNSEVFTDPLVFRPERFLNDEQRQSPFVFTPFSAGIRNCIGQKLAMNELKVILAKIILNFNLSSLEDRSDILMSSVIVLKPYSVKIKLSDPNEPTLQTE